MANFLQKALRVEKKEFPSLLWTILFGAFLGVAIGLYDLSSVTIFLETYKADSLPGALICAGLMGIFTANTFISLQNWVSYTKVACLTLLLLILLAFTINVVFHSAPSDAMIYIGFVLIGPVNVLGYLLFWGLFEKLFDLAQGRRLAMAAESGWVIASVAALTFIALTSQPYFKNPYGLFVVAFWSFVLALAVLVAVSYNNPFLTKIVINVQYIKAYNNYKKLIRQKYILLLAAFSLFSAVTYYLTDYVYLRFVSDQYASEAATLNFLAGFAAAMTGIGFLLQILVLNWVNHKYGYQVSLMVLPVIVGLFTAIYGALGTVEGYNKENTVFFFMFMLVCISRLLTVSLFNSLEFNTFKFFFMPLDNLLRADVQSKIEKVVREAGKVISGVVVILCVHYGGIEYLPYCLLAFILGWCFINIKVNQAYRDKLKISLDKPEEIQKKERVSTSIIDELIRKIPQATEEEIEVFLSLLKVQDPVVYKDSILHLLEHDNEEIQHIALMETSELCLLPAIPILERIQVSKYYPVLKTRDLIDKVYAQLKAAEFRLEKVKYIEQLTLSKLRRERVFGALLAAYAEESMKPRLLNKLFRDQDPKVKYSSVVSSANSPSTDLQKNLIDKLGETFFSNAALSAITATGEGAFYNMENAFYLTGQDEKIQLRIVQAYGRVGTEEAVQLLLKKLNYRNQNVSRAAFEAVSDCGFNVTGDRMIQFKAELEEYVSVLVWNISAFLDLKKVNASDTLLQAMLSEIESNYNSIFKLLTLLYDPKTIALIKENIFSQDPEKSEYAFGLVEVTLAEAIKPFLLPVLTNDSFENKVSKMQEYFPTESMAKVELLYDLVQRDYKYVNRWTKACALKELCEEKEKIDPDIFVANVINPDSLMSETASVALYLKAPELFPPTFERFRRELGSGFSKEIEKKIRKPETVETAELRLDGEDTKGVESVTVTTAPLTVSDYFATPNLKFAIINFLKGIREFKDVPGIILLEVAKITNFFSYKKGETIASYESPEVMDYFLIRSGMVTLMKNGRPFRRYEVNSFLHYYELMSAYEEGVTVVAETDCEIYKIRQEEFNEVMSYYEEIPWSIYNSVRVRTAKPRAQQLV